MTNEKRRRVRRDKTTYLQLGRELDGEALEEALDGRDPDDVTLHELAAHALNRLEIEAKVTKRLDKFENVLRHWDNRDANDVRRWRKWEIGRSKTPLEFCKAEDGEVRPTPFGVMFWKQMLKGDFIEIIFNCPFEIHELVTDEELCLILKELKIDHKEILYYRAIWQYNDTKIAKIRGQSRRNISKVAHTIMKRIRKQYYDDLITRDGRKKEMTGKDRRFMNLYPGDKGLRNGAQYSDYAIATYVPPRYDKRKRKR